MTKKPLIILGSARKQSNTKDFVTKVFTNIANTQVNLLDFHISPYDYSNNYPDADDFCKVVNELLEHETIVFATPV